MSKSSNKKPRTVLGALGSLLLALLIYFLQGGKGSTPSSPVEPVADNAKEPVGSEVVVPPAEVRPAAQASEVPEARTAPASAETSRPQVAPAHAAHWHRTNLQRHWDKHQAEFPEYHSAEEYGTAVAAFVDKPPEGTLRKTTADGDQLFYHPPSNRFAAVTGDGTIKTCFKPDQGIRYWNRQ